jgi:hypothetical protein
MLRRPILVSVFSLLMVMASAVESTTEAEKSDFVAVLGRREKL